MSIDSRLLIEAKKDIPLYFRDFQNFWDSTTKQFKDKDLTDCYANTLIFKNWTISLNHIDVKSLDSLLKEIHEDINASFFHAYFGHYRSAHMHLRSVIELSLQLLYFYQHEVEYEQWQKAEFRIKHEELINYLKKHPALNSETGKNLIDNINTSWKHFSKYIHAEAPNYFQTNLLSAQTKMISIKDFGIWKSNFLETGYTVNKLFLLFFKNELFSFPAANRKLLFRNMNTKDLTELGIE